MVGTLGGYQSSPMMAWHRQFKLFYLWKQSFISLERTIMEYQHTDFGIKMYPNWNERCAWRTKWTCRSLLNSIIESEAVANHTQKHCYITNTTYGYVAIIHITSLEQSRELQYGPKIILFSIEQGPVLRIIQMGCPIFCTVIVL